MAAERTLRRLGARRVKTQKRADRLRSRRSRGALLDHIFDAVNGDAIYRHASFLAGKLGEQIFGKNVTIVDDGTMPRRLRHASLR